jgi:hypothetical protein
MATEPNNMWTNFAAPPQHVELGACLGDSSAWSCDSPWRWSVTTDTNRSRRDEVAPGVYQHYKGALYIVLCFARHTETNEGFVVYRSVDCGDVWVRPSSMFAETVRVGGEAVARFRKVRPSPIASDLCGDSSDVMKEPNLSSFAGGIRDQTNLAKRLK